MNQTISNGTTYTTTTITKEVAGNTWDIMQVIGKINYVSVCKKTNNAFGGRVGKDFKDFKTAAQHYKSPAMKTALLMAEIEFDAASKKATDALIVAELNRMARNN